MKTDISHYTIVAIEDDLDHQLLLGESLKGAGIKNIVFLSNEAEVNKYFFKPKKINSSKPMVILLDIRLPKISGIEILKKLKRHPFWKNIRTIMLTCSERPEDKLLSQKLGANDYVIKPIMEDKIKELLSD